MSSVTFSTGVGGDGSTVTDDNDATTGLREGGWKTRFVPCFTQQVAVANYVVSAATSALGGATTNSTSATSLVIGTGSKSLTLGETGKAYIIGQYVIIASTALSSNYMIGQVTSFSGTTLVVNVTIINGSGTIAAWSISVTGGQTATNLAAGSAGTIPYQSSAGTTQMLAAGTSGQVLTSAGASAPTWQTSNSEPFGTDLSFEDYSLTTSTALTVGASATYFQAVSLDGTSELFIIYGTASAHAVVYNTSTSTFGTPTIVRTAGFANLMNNIAIAKISSTAVLVSSLVAGGSTALETVVLTVSGSTITVGTALATTLAAASSLIAPNTRLVAVGSSYVLNYYTTADSLPKFRAITVSGSTPSIGAELAYAGGTVTGMHHSYAQSATILLHFSMTAATTVFALPITVSGTTLTAGTAATVTTTSASAFVTGKLSSSRYALAYLDSTGRGAVVSVAGSVASISTAATTMAVTTWAPMMQVFGSQAFIVGGTAATEFINVITDTAGVATLGTSLGLPSTSGISGFLSTGKIFITNVASNGSAYYQYGISSGSPVLEKTFPSVTNASVVVSTNTPFYSRPLSGPPQSGSGAATVTLRTSTGKNTTSNTSSPFVVSIDGTYPAKLQQSANPFSSYNDGISNAVAWGIPTSIAANITTVQLRKVTLI